MEIGSVYNHWTVLKLDHVRTFKCGAKHPHYECRCSCGAVKIVSGPAIKSGHSRQCKDCGRNSSSLKSGESAFNILVRNYKRNARNRGLVFELSKDYLGSLFKSNCFWCGKAPSQTKKSGTKRGDYVYNGIDRVDNNEGYTQKNVVACCGRCNESKMDRSKEEFLEMVALIYRKHYV